MLLSTIDAMLMIALPVLYPIQEMKRKAIPLRGCGGLIPLVAIQQMILPAVVEMLEYVWGEVVEQTSRVGE
jgi:hypothetical protein